MNKELIQKVTNKILENPEHFSMSMWLHSNCTTTACIGGWATALSEDVDVVIDDSVKQELTVLGEESGRKALDIPRSTAQRLFYLSEWPERHMRSYKSSNTDKEKAHAAARHIKDMFDFVDIPTRPEYLNQ